MPFFEKINTAVPRRTTVVCDSEVLSWTIEDNHLFTTILTAWELFLNTCRHYKPLEREQGYSWIFLRLPWGGLLSTYGIIA
jgi:hypothetical protein